MMSNHDQKTPTKPNHIISHISNYLTSRLNLAPVLQFSSQCWNADNFECRGPVIQVQFTDVFEPLYSFQQCIESLTDTVPCFGWYVKAYSDHT